MATARTSKNTKKQKSNGSWEYPTKEVCGKKENYNQYETFNKLGVLVEKYGFNKTHPAIEKTADYCVQFGQTRKCN